MLILYSPKLLSYQMFELFNFGIMFNLVRRDFVLETYVT